jgi:hypothetical protein
MPINIFGIPQASGSYQSLGKHIMIHDLNALEPESTELIEVAQLLSTGPFVNLTGTILNFSNASKYKKTITADTVLTISGLIEGEAGLLLVTQDGTGNRTLEIEGKGIVINSDYNTSTLIGIVCTGAGQYEFSSNAGDTYPVVVAPGGWQTVTFANDLYGNGQLSGGVYSSNANGWNCDYINPSITVPANQDFEYIVEINSNYQFGAAIGIHTNGNTPVIPGTNLIWGTYDANDNINFQFLELSNFNNQQYAATPKSQPYYLGIRRVGSDLFIISSPDKITWTQEFDFANTESGILYPRLMLFGGSAISEPEIRFI